MPESLLRSRYVMAGTIRTHYVETGHNGPPVVLCHGGAPGFSGEVGFEKIMPALATRFQVYAIDGVGGYGYTDPYCTATKGVQSRVDHLEAFIDTLCLDRVYLAGNSQGAWVIAKYALQHPDRVRKIVLSASATIAAAMGFKHPQTEGLRALRAYDGTSTSMRAMMETLFWDRSQITDELVERYQASATRPGAMESRRAFLTGMQQLTQDPILRKHFDMREMLPGLRVPARFIWGEEDRFAPVRLGQELEKMLPDIPFTYVPRAGHIVQSDQPKLVAEMLLEFFE